MTRKIVKIEYLERGYDWFLERYACVYLEGSRTIPSYIVSARDLEIMGFGC